MKGPARALVTGASSGIGRVFALQLATSCDEIMVTSRRENVLRELVGELQAQGVAAVALPADLSTTIGRARLIEAIRQRGPLRYLINNAGFGTLGPFCATDPVRQGAMLRLHLDATLGLTLAALPGMRDAGGGFIVNVSSMVALAPFGGLAAYGGSKAFLNNFSSALQQEVADQGIRVQCLCPGYTRTGFHQTAALSDFDPASVPDAYWMEAEDVVRESLEALHGDLAQPLVIPGEHNRAMARRLLEQQLASL